MSTTLHKAALRAAEKRSKASEDHFLAVPKLNAVKFISEVNSGQDGARDSNGNREITQKNHCNNFEVLSLVKSEAATVSLPNDTSLGGELR